MNILVTGGAGYIGSATAEALVRNGHSVTVYDSLATGHRAAVPDGAAFIQADLSDSQVLAQALGHVRDARPDLGAIACLGHVAAQHLDAAGLQLARTGDQRQQA